MQVQPLPANWTLRAIGSGVPDAVRQPIRASVPGCVHTDLLEAGLIPDPYLDDNERAVAWVGRTDWRYQTSVEWAGPACERIDLVFDGLDTCAAVSVSGRLLGRTRNMHRSYRFDVTDVATDGPFALRVDFASAYTEALAEQERLGPRTNAYPEPFQYLRKMACSFGWDWGPTLVTAGIWRPARLVGWDTARLAEVRPEVTLTDSGDGRVVVRAVLERTDPGADAELTLCATIGDGPRATRTISVPPGTGEASIEVDVRDPEVWWPHTLGGQPRHPLTVTLARGGEVLDTWTRRIGFRTVALDRTPDDDGTPFRFVVNGTPVFVRGVNWIPDDVFPSRVTPDRYRHRLSQAKAAGVDLIRVWGGGIYEDEAFYDACDELGLLVWQDFLFACAAYPEEEPLVGEIEAEAYENVARLMPHPSLALWNGNNENLWLCDETPWPERHNGTSWGESYYLDVLPRIVADVDPTRPYAAGSPWSGSWDHPPNDPDHQTHHSWAVWNQLDYMAYRDSVPRFVAEFGWQSPPAWATLRRSVTDDPLTPDSPGVLHHQKAHDGNGKLRRGLERHVGWPGDDVDAWHYLTQLTQVRAVRTGVDHWRSHWPRCAGTILWQLNDCWPVTSWAAIDGDGRPKPLYHALRELYDDVLVMYRPQPEGGLLAVVVNHGRAEVSGGLVIGRHDGWGALDELTIPITVGAGAVVTEHVPLTLGDPNREFLVAAFDGRRAIWYGVEDTEFDFPATALDIRVEGRAVAVTAHTLARDILVQADRIDPDARADQGFFTLLAGEQKRVEITGIDRLDPAAVRQPFVVTSLNDVLRRIGTHSDG